MHQQVARKMFIVWGVPKILVEKVISLVLFGSNCSFKQSNTLSLAKELFIKVFMVRRLGLVTFLQGKVLCISTHRQVASLRFYLTQIIHSNGKIL